MTRIWQCDVVLGNRPMDQSGREHDDATGAAAEAREWYGHLSDRERRTATATISAYDVDADGDMISVPGCGCEVILV